MGFTATDRDRAVTSDLGVDLKRPFLQWLRAPKREYSASGMCAILSLNSIIGSVFFRPDHSLRVLSLLSHDGVSQMLREFSESSPERPASALAMKNGVVHAA